MSPPYSKRALPIFRRPLPPASVIYGRQFNARLTLKALCYFHDGDLSSDSAGGQRPAGACRGRRRSVPTATPRAGVPMDAQRAGEWPMKPLKLTEELEHVARRTL